MAERIWLKNYPAGVPAEIDADRFRSIPDMFEKIVAKFSDGPAPSGPRSAAAAGTLSVAGVEHTPA